MEKIPVIGISGGSADSASVRAMFTQIRSAGATPLFLSNHARRSAAVDLQKIDGLVVLGNDKDIDPERYGQTAHKDTKPESATPEGKARADYEYELMLDALKSGMPVMGVCAGMQRLNVLLGGSLHQDLVGLTGHTHDQRDEGVAPFIPVQPVLFKADTMLSDVSKNLPQSVYTPTHGTIAFENSMHHQGIDRVGEGLRASAYTVDRMPNGTPLIEAIEGDPKTFGGQFVLGVQWHPEFGASPLGAKLAERVTQESRKFALLNKREHPMYEAVEENIMSALPAMPKSFVAGLSRVTGRTLN